MTYYSKEKTSPKHTLNSLEVENSQPGRVQTNRVVYGPLCCDVISLRGNYYCSVVLRTDWGLEGENPNCNRCYTILIPHTHHSSQPRHLHPRPQLLFVDKKTFGCRFSKQRVVPAIKPAANLRSTQDGEKKDAGPR